MDGISYMRCSKCSKDHTLHVIDFIYRILLDYVWYYIISHSLYILHSDYILYHRWYCIYDICISLWNYIISLKKLTNITPCFFQFFGEQQKVTRSQEFPGLLWASSAATGACEAAARVRCSRNYRTLPRPETLIWAIPLSCPSWLWLIEGILTVANLWLCCDSDTCPWCWLVFATYSTSQFLRGSKVGQKIWYRIRFPAGRLWHSRSRHWRFQEQVVPFSLQPMSCRQSQGVVLCFCSCCCCCKKCSYSYRMRKRLSGFWQFQIKRVETAINIL